MKKYWGGLLFILSISLFAEPIQLYDFASSPATNYSFRFAENGQDAVLCEICGEKYLQLNYVCGEAPWVQLELIPEKWIAVPDFKSAEFLLELYVPPDKIRDVCLHLIDRDGEVFQFRTCILEVNGNRSFVKGGFRIVKFLVSTEDLRCGFWPLEDSKTAKSNKQIDFPVMVFRITLDYMVRQGIGNAGLGKLFVDTKAGK